MKKFIKKNTNKLIRRSNESFVGVLNNFRGVSGSVGPVTLRQHAHAASPGQLKSCFC